MSDRDMTPERLDGLFDGTIPPTEDADRDMLALAGALREAAPGADDRLRERVRAIGKDAPSTPGRQRRLRLPGALSRMRVAGPVLAAALVAVVSVGIVTRDGGSSNDDLAIQAGQDADASSAEGRRTAPAYESTAGQANAGALDAAPPAVTTTKSLEAARVEAGPFRILVPPGRLDEQVDEAVRIVEAAGGEAIPTPQPEPTPGVLVAITLPVERAREIVDRIAELAAVEEEIPLDAGVGTRILFTEAP